MSGNYRDDAASASSHRSSSSIIYSRYKSLLTLAVLLSVREFTKMAKLDTESVPIDASLNMTYKGWPAIAQDEERMHTLIVQCVRALIADLCQQFERGHPGYLPSLKCNGVPLET